MTKTYPLYYYSRRGSRDKTFVLDRMHFIPDDLKDAVSSEYERLFLNNGGDGRRLANEYLHKEALKHKENKSRARLVKQVKQ